jgi:hypothetical protein
MSDLILPGSNAWDSVTGGVLSRPRPYTMYGSIDVPVSRALARGTGEAIDVYPDYRPPVPVESIPDLLSRMDIHGFSDELAEIKIGLGRAHKTLFDMDAELALAHAVMRIDPSSALSARAKMQRMGQIERILEEMVHLEALVEEAFVRDVKEVVIAKARTLPGLDIDDLPGENVLAILHPTRGAPVMNLPLDSDPARLFLQLGALEAEVVVSLADLKKARSAGF